MIRLLDLLDTVTIGASKLKWRLATPDSFLEKPAKAPTPRSPTHP